MGKTAFADDDVLEQARNPVVVGDRAGEHLALERGDFEGLHHVLIAFALEVLLFGFAPGLGARELGSMLTDDPAVLSYTFWIASGVIGAAIALIVFHNRWRCIEAVASRYMTSSLRFNLLYVPFVALVYANWRGVQKLRNS